MHLQRLAHEARGAGQWERVSDAIPVTHPGDTLAMLDVTEERHSRLLSPCSTRVHDIEEKGKRSDRAARTEYSVIHQDY